MDIAKELRTRILATAGSVGVWRTSMNTAELMIAYILGERWNPQWRNDILWKDGILPHARNWRSGHTKVTHQTGIETLIRYSLRLRTWTNPREAATGISASTQTTTFRRMKEPSNREFFNQVRAAYRARVERDDGTCQNGTRRKDKNPRRSNFQRQEGNVNPTSAPTQMNRDGTPWDHRSEICNGCQCPRWPQRRNPRSTEGRRLREGSHRALTTGGRRIANMDHIDYYRMTIVAKEFQTSISWVRANIKLVVPIKLLSD